MNSNGDNSTVNNILNNDNSNNSLKYKITSVNENLDIKFGSDDFYKMLSKIQENKRKEFFTEIELNHHIDYKYACDIDDRSFCQIYFSFLKEFNNIIFPFSFCGESYILPILRFSFLIIQLILYLTISAIFFSDKAVDNIFEKNNKFDVGYMIKPMVITFFICFALNILFKYLIKSNNDVIEMKYEKRTSQEVLKAIRLKIIFYFVFGFIIMTFGWLLISSFCSIFTNSQISLIKYAGYTLAANFLFQIIFCFLISSLRTCSLNSDGKKNKCLYDFSEILTYI